MKSDDKPNLDNIKSHNENLFSKVKSLKLSSSQYALTGSSALGIRNLRMIHDIDMIVSFELWDELSRLYGITDDGKVRKIVFQDGLIEAFGEGSFYSEDKELAAPSVKERIARADIIQGLPFETLADVLYYKRKMGREKDLKDIILIEAIL